MLPEEESFPDESDDVSSLTDQLMLPQHIMRSSSRRLKVEDIDMTHPSDPVKTTVSAKYPHALKAGLISHASKGVDLMEAKNWRPVVILNSTSKVLERVLKKQIKTYLELSRAFLQGRKVHPHSMVGGELLGSKEYGGQETLWTPNFLNVCGCAIQSLPKGDSNTKAQEDWSIRSIL